MTHHTYKSIELTGSSPTGIEDAVNSAIAKASRTVHNLRWFQVTEVRGQIDQNKVAHWQVTMKLGFSLDH
ncbi:dodecin [Fontimonas sp. SYSU GA230001]|uniref:dodecin n=1 Tax=Fontimonas sp. SYSU GA230001 TaxID=3142450 RepID=UPI0032B3CF28